MNNPEKTEIAQEPLPEHLAAIGERYGRDLFDAALRIAGMSVALDYLLVRTRKFPGLAHLHPMVDAIAKGLADLNNDLISAKGWHLEDVTDCIAEIGKAQQDRAPRIVRPH